MEFSKAFYTLMQDEGLWILTNDPNDPGGETWSGISRASWGNWGGWPLIDEAKSGGKVSSSHKNFPEIKRLTEAFYEKEFWKRLDCDKLPDALAYEIFEQAVNLGIGRVVRHIQRVLNSLNRPKGNTLEYGADLAVDGKYGNQTRSRILAAVANGRADAILNGINGLQCAHYIELGENTSRRIYVNGWLSKRGRAGI